MRKQQSVLFISIIQIYWKKYHKNNNCSVIKVNGKTSDFNPGMKENTLFPPFILFC